MKSRLLKLLLIIFSLANCYTAFAWESAIVKILDDDFIPKIDSVDGGYRLSSEIEEYNSIINKYVFVKFELMVDDSSLPPESYLKNLYYFQFKTKDDHNHFIQEVKKAYNDKFTGWITSDVPVYDCSPTTITNHSTGQLSKDSVNEKRDSSTVVSGPIANNAPVPSSPFWVKYYFTDSAFVPQVDKTYKGPGVKLTSKNKEYKAFLDSFVFESFSSDKWLEEEEWALSLSILKLSWVKICEYTFKGKEQLNQFIAAMDKYRDAYAFYEEENPQVIMLGD